MEYIVVGVFAFIVGVFLGQDIERGKYPEKFERDVQEFIQSDDFKNCDFIKAMKALVKRNDEICETNAKLHLLLDTKEKEINKQKKEILNLYKHMDNALADKRDLIEMLDKLISRIHVEPYMNFTAQSTYDLEKLANDYAIKYLGLTKEEVEAFEYAEDDDINKLQLKYASALINNVLIADLDRKYITEYLSQTSKQMPESDDLSNKEIDTEYDEKIKKGLEIVKGIISKKDN